jgi:hypothetical protein
VTATVDAAHVAVSPLERTGRVVARTLALAAACAMFPMLVVVLRRAVDVPFWDEWAWADFAYGVHRHTLTFAQLWEQHAEHRVFGDNLMMLLLDVAGGWSVVREQVVSLVFLAATQLFVWLLIRRTVGPVRRDLLFVVATLLLFGFAQSENFSSGYQMAWFICNLCAVVAIWALSRPARRPRDVLLAFAVAILASLTLTQGMVIWLAGAITMVLLRRRGTVGMLLPWLACGAITAYVVRHGAWAGEASSHLGLGQLGALAAFALAYLGSPLARSFGDGIVVLAGAIVALMVIGVAAWAFRAPPAARVRLAPWFAIASYAFACALLTASGRGGSGTAVALSSRYTSISEYAWIAALALACIALPAAAPRLRFAPMWIACAAIAIGSIEQSVWANQWWVLSEDQLRTARAQLANGQFEAIKLINPDVAAVTRKLGWLAEVRDGLFSEP